MPYRCVGVLWRTKNPKGITINENITRNEKKAFRVFRVFSSLDALGFFG